MIQVYEGDGVEHKPEDPRFELLCDELVTTEEEHKDQTTFEMSFFKLAPIDHAPGGLLSMVHRLLQISKDPSHPIITVVIRCGTDRHVFNGHLRDFRNRTTQNSMLLTLVMELPL